MSPNVPAEPKCILEPVDFHDPVQADELLRQRKICGWALTPGHIASWRDAMDAGGSSLFWIKPASQPGLHIGHIGLDSEAHPPDLDLANPHDKSVLSITRLFILPEHRGGGIGRAAMEALEGYARKEPYGAENCRAVAVTALSRKYYEDDEWRKKEWERLSGQEALKRGGRVMRTGTRGWVMSSGKMSGGMRITSGPGSLLKEKWVASFMRKTLG